MSTPPPGSAETDEDTPRDVPTPASPTPIARPGLVPLHDRLTALDNLRDDTEETAPTAIPTGLDLAEFGDDAFTDDFVAHTTEEGPVMIVRRQSVDGTPSGTIVPTKKPGSTRHAIVDATIAFVVAAGFTLVAIALLASLAAS